MTRSECSIWMAERTSTTPLLPGREVPAGNPLPAAYDAYVFDMDGTIYLGDQLLPGVERLMSAISHTGRQRVFLTNNPTRTAQHYAEKLGGLGLHASPEEIITSATIAAAWIRTHHPEAVCFVLGEAPLLQALREQGIQLSRNADDITLVLSSYDRSFDYAKLKTAFEALWRRPAVRFIATHPDPYCPFPNGKGDPDAAAITAAIEASTGRRCEAVLGKPSAEAILTALRLVNTEPRNAVMVGDRLGTDIAMGRAAGTATALVLTGEATLADADTAPAEIRPDFVLSRIDELAEPLLEGQ